MISNLTMTMSAILIPDLLFPVLENCNDPETWKSILVCSKTIWNCSLLHRHLLECNFSWPRAAMNGHLDSIKWLHENRDEGCTRDIMDRAAERGHLDIVTWLHENRKEECTTCAMDDAAEHGHLDVVIWLHEFREEGCTEDAMDGAAANGHIDVVAYLKSIQ